MTTPEPTPETDVAAEPPARSPRRGMCAAILCLEAITLGLTTPVMATVGGVSLATALTVGVGLMIVCLLLAGLLRWEWAFLVGWLVQVAAIGLGFVVPLMFFLGAVFAALWATADLLGRKIQRERAAAYARVAAEPPSGTEPAAG